MALVSKNNPQVLPVSLLNSMIKADTLWVYDPLDYLSWLDDKRTNYSMHKIQL